MRFANPWGLAALALLIPILVLHILKPRRESVKVSSIFLFRNLETPVSAALPWQRLRWSALLIAQLIAVILGSLALAKPVRLTPERLAAHTVFMIDASGSMAATDGSPTRLDDAKQRALDLREQLPDGGVASIIIAGERSRVVLTANADKAAFADSLRTVTTTEGHPDFADAFALAESLDTASSEIGFVLLSDGGLSQDEQKQLPPGTKYERLGSRDLNRAITRLTVEPRGSGLHAIVTARNLGGPESTQTLRLDVDGKTAATTRVVLKPGAAAEFEADLPSGDRVEAFLEGDDLLATDNRAVAVAGRRLPIDVLIVGDPSFIGDLLGAIPGVTVTTAAADAPPAPTVDVIVYAGVPVPAIPPKPYLAIAPPSGSTAVNVVGLVDQPAIALVRSNDSLVEGLDFTEVGLAVAQQVEAPSSDVLIAAEGAPLVVRGTDQGRRFVYLAFHLGDSNLPVQIAFPLLGDRILTELSGTAQTTSSLHVGAALPINPGLENSITDPGSRTRTIAADAPAPRAERSGFWVIKAPELAERTVAVNSPLDESAVAPADQLSVPKPVAGSTKLAARGQESVLAWVIWPLIAVLIVEWFLARRALGVSRRQWRFATLGRVLVAGLLIGALFAPSIRRTANRTATVFLVDDSASLGATGRNAAAEWVAAALNDRGDEDVAGVVAFGGEARLDRLVQQIDDFGGPAVVIDKSVTNIEAALRLGSAVLPEDARRRIVLVTDGRETAGQSLEEAEILRAKGIPVDVVVIEPTSGPDAAVSSLDVPRLARQGDAVKVKAVVTSTRGGPATVVLRRDGEEVERRTVTLAAGDNDVEFTDDTPARPGSVARYQVKVEQGNDSQAANDTAFAAVPIDGPARILIAEGSPGVGATLASALTSGGLVTESIAAADLPDARELAAYTSVILVDVDARELTGTQIEHLDTAVRDLGRGLITIGGAHSYGVGGYRSSPLEDLLPVVSEILDPKRRKRVAEVLSIDTSGSMADCHCADGDVPAARPFGGVNKTDIARAAAARAISSLDETDEIGVIAWNSGSKWVIDLQSLPSSDVVEKGLGTLKPDGATNIRDSLTAAAEALRKSDAALKHIILFSDGFTDVNFIEQVADQAAELNETEGITVSVIATGEGAAPLLKQIADAGKGRFYPGRDLQKIPEILAEEAVIASRDFINEGEFLPEITSLIPATEGLTASPPLLGYIATTSKGTATTALRIGPDHDPLLATWQAGLGTVTSWTSDANVGWSKNWAAWDGFVDFWATVVKDTFPNGDIRGAAQASLENGQLTISVQGSVDFPDGATATVRVAGPDGQRFEVPLERSSSDEFVATVPAPREGSYAVGATVAANGETLLASSAIANESYPAEYRPGPPDRELLLDLSKATGGRGEIQTDKAFDPTGLTAGRRLFDLRWPFLVAAVLLWPVAVALSRLSLRGASLAGAAAGARAKGRQLRSALPTIAHDPVNRPAPLPPDEPRRSTGVRQPIDAASMPPPPPPPPGTTRRVDSAIAPSSTPPMPPPTPTPAATKASKAKQTKAVNELLEAKRRRQSGSTEDD